MGMADVVADGVADMATVVIDFFYKKKKKKRKKKKKKRKKKKKCQPCECMAGVVVVE